MNFLEQAFTDIFQQVILTNQISNLIKHTENKPNKITLSIALNQQSLYLYIYDDGEAFSNFHELIDNAHHTEPNILPTDGYGLALIKTLFPNQKYQEKIEKDFMEILPEDYWAIYSHLQIEHGRKICKARKPDCFNCFLNDICPSSFAGFKKNTDHHFLT